MNRFRSRPSRVALPCSEFGSNRFEYLRLLECLVTCFWPCSLQIYEQHQLSRRNVACSERSQCSQVRALLQRAQAHAKSVRDIDPAGDKGVAFAGIVELSRLVSAQTNGMHVEVVLLM